MNRIKNFRQLNTTAEREIVLELIEAALAAIDPEDVFKAHFKVNGKILIVREKKIDLALFFNNEKIRDSNFCYFTQIPSSADVNGIVVIPSSKSPAAFEDIMPAAANKLSVKAVLP